MFVLRSRAGDTFPDEGKGIRKARPEGDPASHARRKICWRKLAVPLYGDTPPPAPTGGKVGAGKTKCGGILKYCKNALGYRKWGR